MRSPTATTGTSRPREAELAGEALRLVDLEPGERFLDVAAGRAD